MMINWPLLWIGTIVLGIAYFRMRDKISIKKRSKIEVSIMVFIIIFLLLNISFQIVERKEAAENVNDCIRFYRYNYEDKRDMEYTFIQNCYEYLGDVKMEQIKQAGINWRLQN